MSPVFSLSHLVLSCSASLSPCLQRSRQPQPVLVRSGVHTFMLGTRKTYTSQYLPQQPEKHCMCRLYVDKWNTQQFCDLCRVTGPSWSTAQHPNLLTPSPLPPAEGHSASCSEHSSMRVELISQHSFRQNKVPQPWTWKCFTTQMLSIQREARAGAEWTYEAEARKERDDFSWDRELMKR